MQSLLGAITGIKGAPSRIPDQFTDFPVFVSYPGAAQWLPIGLNNRISCEGSIIVELHAGSQDLGINMASSVIQAVWETVAKTLAADPTLNGNITSDDWERPWFSSSGLIEMSLAGIQTYGVRWILRYFEDMNIS